ncbi:MAG: hypothetical protein J6T64_06850, partial [Bacteroidaceae bacterium]|nr:hypothetical protein [Bacteroidaceae bacterium]
MKTARLSQTVFDTTARRRGFGSTWRVRRLLLALAIWPVCIHAQTLPTNLIPMPVEYSVRSGCVAPDEMAGLHERVRISEKALRRRLKGRNLADWQLRSAYWLELGRRRVRIVAADEEGVFYARQTLRMMVSVDSLLTCCTILDWPRFRYRGV